MKPLSWLEENFPNYKAIVRAQVDQLQKDLEGRAAEILNLVETGSHQISIFRAECHEKHFIVTNFGLVAACARADILNA